MAFGFEVFNAAGAKKFDDTLVGWAVHDVYSVTETDPQSGTLYYPELSGHIIKTSIVSANCLGDPMRTSISGTDISYWVQDYAWAAGPQLHHQIYVLVKKQS